FLLVLPVRVLAREALRLLPVAGDEEGKRQLAAPGRVHRVDEELVVSAALLVVVGKRGLLLGEELLDGALLAGEVRRDAEDLEPARSVFLLQPREVRELLAARDAPRGPEIDEDDASPLARDAPGQLLRIHFSGNPRALSDRRRRREKKGGQRRPSPPGRICR